MSAGVIEFSGRPSEGAAALDDAIWRVLDPITRDMDDEALADLEFPMRTMLGEVARQFGHLTIGDVCGLLEHRLAASEAHEGERRHSATDCLVGYMEHFVHEAPARSPRDMIARARWARHDRSAFVRAIGGDDVTHRAFLRIVDDLLHACPETADWQNDDPAATLAGWWAKSRHGFHNS